MVADTVRRRSSADGLRPLNLIRDWRQVIDLIEIAFDDKLDVEARRALYRMRPPPLLAPVIGLLDSLAPPGEGTMPGFVWIKGGRVVGTASVRRVSPYRQRWLISNVAVHPDWRGQGIGRALLEASLDLAADYGGTRVVLQVRDDNWVALKLYESLDFEHIGEIVRLRRTAARPETPSAGTQWQRLRPARWSDGSALFRLARTLTPHEILWLDAADPSLYRTGPLSRLAGWWQGYHRQWWLSEESDQSLRAAVGTETDRRNPWHRLRLLISPGAQDEGLAAELVAFGLAQLADARPLPVELEHPASDAATQSALTQAGFERLYALAHMRLKLR